MINQFHLYILDLACCWELGKPHRVFKQVRSKHQVTKKPCQDGIGARAAPRTFISFQLTASSQNSISFSGSLSLSFFTPIHQAECNEGVTNFCLQPSQSRNEMRSKLGPRCHDDEAVGRHAHPARRRTTQTGQDRGPGTRDEG